MFFTESQLKVRNIQIWTWNYAVLFVEAHHGKLAGQELEAKVHLDRVGSVQAIRAVRPSQKLSETILRF